MRRLLTTLFALLFLLAAVPSPVRGEEIPPILRLESWQKVYEPLYLVSFAYQGGRYWGLTGTGDLYSSIGGSEWELTVPATVGGDQLYVWKDQLYLTTAGGLYRLEAKRWVRVQALQANGMTANAKMALLWDPVGYWLSEDGVKWRQVLGKPLFLGMAAGPSSVVGMDKKGQLFSSANGTDWKQVSLPKTLVPRRVFGGDSGYLLVATDGPSVDPAPDRYQLLVSADGVTWSVLIKLPWLALPAQMGGDFNLFYLRGVDERENYRLLHSQTGQTWSEEPFSLEAQSVAGIWQVGTERWTIVEGALYRSRPGEEWERMGPFVGWLIDQVTYGEKGWVAAASDGSLLHSPDGRKWVVTKSQPEGRVIWITYQGGRYYAMKWESPWRFCQVQLCAQTLLSSSDGRTWTTTDLPDGNWLDLVAHEGKLFFAAGAAGVLGGSSAAKVQAVQELPAGASALSLASFKGGLYAAVWLEQRIQLAKLQADGTFRIVQEKLPIQRAQRLRMMGDQLVLYGVTGITTSKDGLTWTSPKEFKRSVAGVVPFGEGALTLDAELASRTGLTGFGPGWSNPIRRESQTMQLWDLGAAKGVYVGVGWDGIWAWQTPPR